MSNTTKSNLRLLSRFDPRESKFLGRNKSGATYGEQIKQSMARYSAKRRERECLFAFIMPCGHGKTTIARKYGFVDVDELVTDEEHDEFVALRAAALSGNGSWEEHNLKWYERLNQTLDLMDYSMPVIILVHTEETAREIGAQPIGAFKLPEDVFERNIRDRDEQNKKFSRQSYHSMQVTRDVPNFYKVASVDLIEAAILKIMNVSNMPVACPLKFSQSVWNTTYNRQVPSWILRGERAGDPTVDINKLAEYHDIGWIPKECVDYYVRHSYAKTQFDFGVSMWEWSRELGKLPPLMNKFRSFDVMGDMFKVFPPLSAKEVSRSNVTMRHLINTFDIFSHPDAYELAGYHVGEPHVFVTSILCAWKGCLQNTPIAPLLLTWMRVGYYKWADVFKTLHSLIRCSRYIMNTPITESDRQALMYMDLLVGRSEYTIDEMGEVVKRHDVDYSAKHLSFDPDKKMFTNAQYKVDFTRALQQAYFRIKTNPRAINVTSFKDFYMRRRSWITKGGLVSNTMPSGMKKFVAHVFDQVNNALIEIEGRHNKKSLFEVHELYDILAGVNERNFNITKTMIKYEVGNKCRTLLPGSLAYFIVFCYVLTSAEKQEQIGSVRLNDMGDVDIRYFDRKMSTGVFHVLYDWADFNEQHSAWEMAQCIQHLGEVMPQGNDYYLFVDAIVQGMYSMGLEDRAGNIHKLWKGLYSGWRGTTWINTVLNFVYVAVALENLERVTGESCVLMVDHGGDDIDLMLSQPNMMPRFLEIMDQMLFKANKWKQMFGTRSEFFRNTICGARVYASPTRALASFIAGDWEGSGNATVRERVVSLLDQIGKLRRRGLSNEMCQGFTMCTISHWCRVKDGEEWVNLPPTVLHGRQEDNGLGIPDANNQVWILDKPVPEIDEEWYKVVVPDYKASRDYVKVLAQELERFSIVIERQEELAQRLSKDSYDIDKAVDHISWQKLLTFDGKPIAYAYVVEPLEDDSVFEAFINYEFTEENEKELMSASMYQEYIGYLYREGNKISKEELVRIMSDDKVSLEAIEFQGDIYYQRLVPEFIAHRAVMFCRLGINTGLIGITTADYFFKVICWMSGRIFKHMI